MEKRLSVTFFGGMAALLEDESGFRVLADPYFRNNPHTTKTPDEFLNVDLIVVTHSAVDHLGDTVELMEKGRAMLVAGFDVTHRILQDHPQWKERVYGTLYGDDKDFQAVCVRTVMAQHMSRTVYDGVPSFGPPLGFVLRFRNGVTYYHAGDTSIYGDLKLIRELYHPDIACLGIDRWNPRGGRVLPPREAAMVAAWLGADVVIPGHYPKGSCAPMEFARYMEAYAPDTQIRAEVEKTFTYLPYRILD